MRDQVAEVVMQNGATAVGDGTPFDSGVAGFNNLVLQVGISGAATVTFEGSNDGSTWYTVQGTKLDDGSAVTTATASGLYRIDVSGLHQVRARISAYTSGTVDVLGRAQA